MAGIEPLREAIARKIESLYGLVPDPDTEVTVTSGATEALFCAINAVIRAGDEALLFDPCYDSYEPAARRLRFLRRRNAGCGARLHDRQRQRLGACANLKRE